MSTARNTLVTALTPLIWGTTYIVTTELLPPERPLLAGCVRALPAGLLLLALSRKLPQGRWWFKAAVLGLLNIGLFFALLFVAAYRLPGGVAAIFGATGPLLTLFLGMLILHTRFSLAHALLGICGVAGVALVVLAASVQLDAIGVAAAAAGTVSLCLSTILTKKWFTPDITPLSLTAWQLTAGGLFLLPGALSELPVQLSATNTAGFVLLATVHGALAYFLMIRGISLLDPVKVAFLGLLAPVTATVVGWLVLGQALTGWQFAGLVIALGSMAGAQLVRRPAAGSPGPHHQRGGNRRNPFSASRKSKPVAGGG